MRERVDVYPTSSSVCYTVSFCTKYYTVPACCDTPRGYGSYLVQIFRALQDEASDMLVYQHAALRRVYAVASPWQAVVERDSILVDGTADCTAISRQKLCYIPYSQKVISTLQRHRIHIGGITTQ